MDAQPETPVGTVRDSIQSAIILLAKRQADLVGKVPNGVLQRLIHASLKLSEAHESLKMFQDGRATGASYLGLDPSLTC